MPSEIISFGGGDAYEVIPGNDILVPRFAMDPICKKLLQLFTLTEEEKRDFMGLSHWSLGLFYSPSTRRLFEKLLKICELIIDDSGFVPNHSDDEKYGSLMDEFGWGWVYQNEGLIPAFDELHSDQNMVRREYFCTLRLKNFLEAGLARYG